MSLEYTIGVEEEYQLVEPDTGALRSRARDVLASDWADALRAELQQTTVETGTPVCRTAADVAAELGRRRFTAAATAAAEELRIVAAGLHPFSRWQGHRRTDSPRYHELVARYGRLARDEHIFGMHVHVGVPAGKDRARLLGRVRPYAPLLLALSASSRFFEGDDTGYDSFRMILWRRWPLAGPPPRFASDAQHRRFVSLLQRAGAVANPGNVYWTVRVHHDYPTLEFRIMDVCPRVDDAVAIALLARLLVVAAARDALPDPLPTLPEPLRDEVIAYNQWEAGRGGLEARLIAPAEPDAVVQPPAAIRRLLERLVSIAGELDDDVVDRVHAVLRRGNAASRLRGLHAEGASDAELVRWLADETVLGTGFDRRREQRHSVAGGRFPRL